MIEHSLRRLVKLWCSEVIIILVIAGVTAERDSTDGTST